MGFKSLSIWFLRPISSILGVFFKLISTWLASIAKTYTLKTLAQIKHGSLTVVLKDEEPEHVLHFGNISKGQQTSKVVVKSPNLWWRACSQGLDLCFAEAYMHQEIECEDLVNIQLLYIANRDILGQGNFIFQLIPRLLRRILKPVNNKFYSRQNISFHYDTSNELFAGFLSEEMKYSTALWSDIEKETLATAQLNCNRNIIDKALISPSDHVLDIGCGWGSLAIEAVRRTGCHVTGITLSVEQKELAEARIKNAGLQDCIKILLCDYRSVPRPAGGFDRVISVEMIEHVGREYMESFFAEISKLLKKDGGRVVIQGTTLIESVHSAAPTVDTFIDRYIFPGCYLPTINTILASLHTGSKASLEIEHVSNIGPHYIKTLRSWHNNFLEHWESDIKPDLIKRRNSLPDRGQGSLSEEIEACRRTWLYYFSYSEAGFRARILGNHVIVAVRTPLPSIK